MEYTYETLDKILIDTICPNNGRFYHRGTMGLLKSQEILCNQLDEKLWADKMPPDATSFPDGYPYETDDDNPDQWEEEFMKAQEEFFDERVTKPIQSELGNPPISPWTILVKYSEKLLSLKFNIQDECSYARILIQISDAINLTH